jgi:hypothetical protein
VGWFDVHGKTIVGIGAGTQVNMEHTGWFSTGDSPGTRELISDPRVGSAFQQEPMSDANRAAIEANLAAHGLSAEALTANAKSAYADGLARMSTDPAIVALNLSPEQAANWYMYEHDSAIAYADHGQSAYVCAAEVAATTSKAQWSMQTGVGSVYGEAITVYPNLTAAATVAAFGIENPTVTLSQQDCDKINGVVESTFNPDVKSQTAIDPTNFAGQPNPDGFIRTLTPGDYQANQLSDYQLGKYVDMSGNALLPGVPIGLPDGLARGLAIARGDDPADILQGTKQLSFTTNIAFPDENTTTTNDTHIGAEMLTGATYPPNDPQGRSGPMSGPDLAAYVQSFYNAQGGKGYTYITDSIMKASSSEDPPVMGHQYQAVMWVGDPTIAAASTKGVHGELTKASKLDVQFPYRPYTPDDETGSTTQDVLEAPTIELAKKCIVTAKGYKTPPWPKDQRHAAKPKWLKDRIARGDFVSAKPDNVPLSGKLDMPEWFKGFGDPGSTQAQDAHGRFTTGSGASSLEAKAIAHFGAAEELQGQQFITPNGTILNLEGDGHDRIKEVVGGNVATATSRALDAGFLRTSLDTVQGGDLGLVMELTQPMTSQQIASVRQGISDAGGIGYIAVDVANTGGYNRVTGAGGGLLYSQDQEQPTSTQIATIIRDANVAAGAPVNAAAFAELLKGFGDPGSTQERAPNGTFGPGSGERDHAPRLRDITIGSAADTGELAMRSEPITAPHKTDPLAAEFAADEAFSAGARGTHEGDSLTEGFDVLEGKVSGWFKGFGDPGSTQGRDAHGHFTQGNDAYWHNFRGQGDATPHEPQHPNVPSVGASISESLRVKRFGDEGSTQQQDAHGRFTVGSGAPRDAANLKYPELDARAMPGTNSPLMSRQEFQASAARGEDIVNNAIANGSPPVNMMTGANIQATVDAVQEKWGGITIDAHGGGIVSQVTQPPDPVSVSMRAEGQSSVVISAAMGTADPGTLMAAMQQGQSQFADQLSAQGAALGVFRDELSGTIQIDPVLVVQGIATARDVGAFTGATGGAFRFVDSFGYYPGHVAG